MANTPPLYTILGAGGSVGNALTDDLLANKRRVRLVSRSSFSREGTQSVRADLASAQETAEAVKGSAVVFLCAGLLYIAAVWRDLWPRIMTNTIEACQGANASLIFLDNVYAYGRVAGSMTEETPYNPCSRKGEVRAAIAGQLLREVKQGNLRATIARSADWYGPYGTIKTSIPQMLVFERLRRGQKANWLVNPHVVHSFSYTLDCGKGLRLLADDAATFNQVWHLPTAHPPITGMEFIRVVAKQLGVPPRTTVLRKWMVRLAGLGDSSINEAYEMLYQSEVEYRFDSTKFERHFRYHPVPYGKGIAETVRRMPARTTV